MVPQMFRCTEIEDCLWAMVATVDFSLTEFSVRFNQAKLVRLAGAK